MIIYQGIISSLIILIILIVVLYSAPVRSRLRKAAHRDLTATAPALPLEIYPVPVKRSVVHNDDCPICRSPVTQLDRDKQALGLWALATFRGWTVHADCKEWRIEEHRRREAARKELSPSPGSSSGSLVQESRRQAESWKCVSEPEMTTWVTCTCCDKLGRISEKYPVGGPIPSGTTFFPPPGHIQSESGIYTWWSCPGVPGSSGQFLSQPAALKSKSLLYGRVLPPAQAADLHTGLRRHHQGSPSGVCTACGLAGSTGNLCHVTNGGQGTYHKECYEAALKANPEVPSGS